jgi:hypothetical protein
VPRQAHRPRAALEPRRLSLEQLEKLARVLNGVERQRRIAA